jgi:DNA mismatch repair ATPase MutS
MRVRLMDRDSDFDARASLPDNASALIADLQLEPMFAAMTRGDPVLEDVVRPAVLNGLTDPAKVRYRQAVLVDCTENPSVVAELYAVCLQAIQDEHSVYRSALSERWESQLHSSASVLTLFKERLTSLRRLAGQRGGFTSEAFTAFWDVVEDELRGDYIESIGRHAERLRHTERLLASAGTGEGNQVSRFLMRTPDEAKLGMFRRVPLRKPTYSYTVPDRDEATSSALGELRDHILRDVSAATTDATDHLLDFFLLLRDELAFYRACMNLRDILRARGVSTALPEVFPPGTSQWSADDIVDPALALTTNDVIVGNRFDSDARPLIVVTGANHGGKSTFLRALGSASLMAACGMFVTARQCRLTLPNGLYTHFKREEDPAMRHGKFDEELVRMAELTTRVRHGSLLLSNESFAATNEREGSEIGAAVFSALVDSGVHVALVTHMYELAAAFANERQECTTFLRAERGRDGLRPYVLVSARPLRTSYAADLYQQIFETESSKTAESAGGNASPLC